jgi:hypothetical protein
MMAFVLPPLLVMTMGVASPSAIAQATGAAALVEDVSGVTGIGAFDYVSAGQRIALGTGGQLTLGYLGSCVEETIAGGMVIVGAEQSTVDGGTVQRKTVACAGRTLQLSTDQSGKSGGIVFRKPPATAVVSPQPLVIHGASPVVSLPQPGKLGIVRIDQPGDALTLDLPGKPVDLATRGVRLAPGGAYRASYGSAAITFRIDGEAAGPGSPLVRLIRF